jgi:hypothetical protein
MREIVLEGRVPDALAAFDPRRFPKGAASIYP